jgi:hypothetical protein
MKPAIVAAKLKICAAVAGATGVSIKCFPPAPVATTKTRRDGAQAQFSYLQKVRKILRLFPIGRKCSPVENPEPTEGHLSMEAIRNRNIEGIHLLTKREINEMITIPTLTQSVRFMIA